MGSPFNIILLSDDSLKAVTLAHQAFQLVDSLVHIYSDYDSTAELYQLSTHSGMGPRPVSSTLWNILQEAKKGFEWSKGSFDITVGPLSQIWRKARRSKTFPDSTTVQTALAKVGFEKIRFYPESRSVELTQKGMVLDLGGIAQGAIAQQVIDQLKSQGINSALVDVSGDIVMSDAPKGTKGWTVAVNVPESMDETLPKKLELQNMAVTTSGDAYQYLDHNGKRYSHIIDPRTGYGNTEQRNVTVIAPNGTDADWLTKICTLMSVKEAAKIVEHFGGALLVNSIQEGKMTRFSSKGFATYWK